MAAVPAQIEVLSESEHTRVVRLHLAEGGTVIRKEPMGASREERVSHEVAILRRLAGVTQIVQLARDQPDRWSITLQDIRGVPLTEVATPLDSSRLVDLVLGLARAVAVMHQRGVVHRDVNPANILLANEGRSLYLIDFTLAMTFAELRPEFTHHKEVVGTLPYLAPEQTGRTGRSVDRRADLYGLGATMYELATGGPPFGTGDPLRLIHDHLARAAVPPATVNEAIPSALSEIIMHLLEKEPDNRYQTAEGLIRDLERVRDGARWLRAGEDDISPRLTKPSRLVGRDHEIDVLRSAFEAAVSGECRGVLVSGESGVGKTALVDELRPIVTAGDGWFAYGKFDRYRRDAEYDGVRQAFRALGRLLLAEPEDELEGIRQRLLTVLGANAGMAAAVLPEFATLLDVRPDAGEAVTAQVRARQTGLELLRSVASRKRPVVYVVDDVQWAGVTPLSMLDTLFGGEEEIEGLLLVAAYRETDVQEADPLTPMLARWDRRPDGPAHLRITNLDQHGLAAMVAEMLRSPPEAAADLAGSIVGLTKGNPYETVELLNGLRHEGILQPSGSGWRWDPVALDRRLARENVTELMQSRVDGMPAATRHALDAMACLGGEVELHALEVATGLDAGTVQQRLTPALEDGLLVMVGGLRGVRFQHDRLRDMVLSGIPPQRLRVLRLSMARRLSARPELATVAADQYLPVIETVPDAQERRRAVVLLRGAAEQSMWVGESLPAERMLATAARLTDDRATLVRLHTGRHTALFRLGRLTEADEVFDRIVALSTGPYDRVDATSVQISSLTNRNRPEEAIDLGLNLLAELGWAAPAPDQVDREINEGLDWCSRWIDETDESDDLSRPDVTDPTITAAGTLISRMLPACFFRDRVTMAWLALAATRNWAERGPTRSLIGAVGHLPWVFVERRGAYRSGYRLILRLLAVGEERGLEPGLSQTRFLYSLGLCQWFRPLEEAVEQARRAREGLIRGGELQAAAYAYCAPVYEIDVASTVDEYAAEVDAALAFCDRTGNEHARGIFEPYRWLVAVLRGEPATPEREALANAHAGEPLSATNANIVRGLAGALFEDPASLDEHSRAAMSLRPAVEATYGVWQAHLVRAIALAERGRTATGRAAELGELDRVVAFISQRAADMPQNFQHLLSLVEAERAWAARDFRTAIQAFDIALRDAGHRPWHRAYIAERSAKFMLAHGLDHAGWSLLVEAREAYRVWGARAKVDQLDLAYPGLDVPTEILTSYATRRASITAGAIDMMGILAASRALSSETSVGAVKAKVVEVLSALTGATHVGLLLWNAEQSRWLAAYEEGDGLTPASDRHPVPQSVVRYVERTREPLIIGNAKRDDRFARDPYFMDLTECSVLAVPVLSRGALQAILLLENHLIRDAFPAERLDAVMLIAGQLAVSLDNALVYASLERKVAERTQQLALANERLEQLSITDPLTGLANRRRMAEVLRDEWVRARRTRAPLSLAMVDIDHFKQYNDLHGHRAGDRCLQHVATQLDASVRDTDLVARYGGEEFAIIMPDTGATAGSEAAERIRKAIIDLHEPMTEGEVVTASVGVATLDDAEQQTTDQLLERADAALYRAKRAGRNRVRTADA